MIQYEYLDGSAGFTNALKDFKEHFRSYMERWEHGDKGDELRTPEWREECRYFLRIETYDDANIPVPNEDEILDREYGTVIMPDEAREG